LSSEVRGKSEKPWLHLWSENHNLTRRVLAITDHSATGAKYWLRVNRHLEQEDFPGYGFFPGTQLRPTPPVGYLVATALGFHPATEVLLRYLNLQMDVVMANRPLRGPAPINLPQATFLASGKFHRYLSCTVGLYLPCKRKGYFS
jgi:hypothetical protein